MSTTETYLWHIWPARHWPASATEEVLLVQDLDRLAGIGANEILPFERGDLTTILNTLRNGMTVADLLAVAPGVQPARLLSAYRHIDRLRAESVRAFTSLATNICDHTVNEDAPRASQLLPVPTYRLVAAWMNNETVDTSATSLDICAQVQHTNELVTAQEELLASGQLSDLDAVRLGRVLYDPFAGGLWSHPYYAPSRAGVLVPARVRDLLGEKDE